MEVMRSHQAWPMKGIALIVFATMAFALADVLTKQLVTRYPVVVTCPPELPSV